MKTFSGFTENKKLNVFTGSANKNFIKKALRQSPDLLMVCKRFLKSGTSIVLFQSSSTFSKVLVSKIYNQISHTPFSSASSTL